MKKICKEGTLDDLLLLFESKIPSFLEHVFVKREQFKYFEEKLTNLDKDEAVIQVDFAENYTCKYQDEIQSAHWNQEQVTLFTVAIWTKNPSAPGNLCKTHVIVSDDVAHDKTSVSVFMSTILDDFVKKMHPNVTKAYIFSDGPSSQFKNKYIVNFLHKLNQTIHIQWNFFATSHGKGVVDGVGGTIKRLVWKALIARKAAVVVDAKTFYLVAKQLQSICKRFSYRQRADSEKVWWTLSEDMLWWSSCSTWNIEISLHWANTKWLRSLSQVFKPKLTRK